MQVIGQQDVLRQAFVSGDLVGFQNLVEVLADLLVLDIAENHARARDLEVGRALAGEPLGLVLDRDAAGRGGCKFVQQAFQGGPAGMLGLLIQRGLTQLVQVDVEDIGHRRHSDF